MLQELAPLAELHLDGCSRQRTSWRAEKRGHERQGVEALGAESFDLGEHLPEIKARFCHISVKVNGDDPEQLGGWLLDVRGQEAQAWTGTHPYLAIIAQQAQPWIPKVQ